MPIVFTSYNEVYQHDIGRTQHFDAFVH